MREGLGVQPSLVLKFIEQRQLCWWGHTQRMDNNRQDKRTYEATAQIERKKGRPILTWNIVLGNIIQERGNSWEDAKILTRSRKEWKMFIYEN
ncbi:hypothetical protein WA026_011810 [Henosepilachna vigintioctopunctata]|uniref:Uncharacterized protein n=1 Tax=Henosepilachna vigintioctopunctata TaxID=420089 RepID=A0AAW1UDG7_9CUCU